MSNPKISVIVPVYNVEKYLSECLGSIVNQTLKDIEIICVNDGSTDNSLAILKKYASKDNRIKIIDKENEGQGYARKLGLDNATGDYILFCDSDDYYAELAAFEELYNYIEDRKVDVVIFNHIRNYTLEGRIEKIGGNYPQKETFSYLDMDNIFAFRVTAWLKLYSRKFLNSYDDWYFPKKIKYEDIPFHFQIFTRAEMAYMDKYFYTYRLRAKSTVTSSITIDRIFDLCKIFKEIYNITKNRCHLSLFFAYFYSNLFSRLFNYQIKDVEAVKYIIDTIKQFDISELSECKNRDAIFLIKAGFRMSPEDFMEYLNKKNLKIKNREISKLKEDKKNRDTRIKTLNEQLQQKNETIAKRDEVIKTKNEQLQQKNEQIKTKNEQLQQKNEQIKTKNEQIKTKNEQIKNRDSAIKQKNNEIQNLHNQTNIQEQAIKRLENSWSYRIGRLFTYPLSIPLDFYRFLRDYNLIKKSSLFDSEYYLSQNEDVRKAKMNPIKHYLKFGWKEGRNPSAEFNGNEYLNKRPDVHVAGICPLVHFIKFGKDEK